MADKHDQGPAGHGKKEAAGHGSSGGHGENGFFSQIFSGFSEGSGHNEKPDVGPIPVTAPKSVFTAGSANRQMYRVRVRFKGVFNLDGLYKKMVLWFKRRHFEFQERLYKDKPPELEIVWQARRRRTGYIMDIIDVHIHIFDMEPVEVIERGVRKQLTHARMTITLLPTIETGYADIFGHQKWNSDFHRRLMEFYNKYVLKRDLDLAYDDTLYYELYVLHAFIKDYLKMEARGNMY